MYANHYDTGGNNRYQYNKGSSLSRSASRNLIGNTNYHSMNYMTNNGNGYSNSYSQVPNQRYQDAYDHCSLARTKVQTRLDHLISEKNMLLNMRGSFDPYSNDMSSLYNMRSLSNARGQLANPNLYSYQFMDPIYYPLEMPINGEPVALPNIEVGAPLNNNSGCNGNGGMGISELIMLLTALENISPQAEIEQKLS